MALKGTTRIELTNVKTGQKEVYEKDNLVTNAVNDILTLNPLGAMFRRTALEYGGYEDTHADYLKMLPLCPNLFGGILLFEKALEEDATKYYAPQDNHLLGYSSNDASPGTDLKRGSMNQTESGPLEDGSGYRFVFDFATSQANGTIASLGLTSKWGGACGYGSNEVNKRYVPFDTFRRLQYPTEFTVANNSDGTYIYRVPDEVAAYAHIIAFDLEKNKSIAIRMSGENTIDILETTLPLASVPLNYAIYKGASVNKITLATSSFGALKSGEYGGYLYCSFCDGGDGYVYGFQHQNNTEGNSTGNAIINWVKIKKEDYSIEEGTWDLGDIQLYKFGMQAHKYLNWETNFIVHDGYLYCSKYDASGHYKIKLDNITDIELLEGNSWASINDANYCGRSRFNLCGNVVVSRNGYFENDEYHVFDKQSSVMVSQQKNTDGCANVMYPKLTIGPFMVSYLMYNYNSKACVYQEVNLMAPYLATINNLATPVEKTADKTMKITYILREE